jgi:hypothetical protein
LAEATDASISRLEEVFAYKLRYRPHIVVYNSQADFLTWAPAAIVDRFIGMASGEWGGAVVTLWKSTAYTGYTIIQHELAHLFQFQSIRREAPRWWMEGTASYFEQVPDEDVYQRTRDLVITYGPPELTWGMSNDAPDGSNTPYVYYVGQTVAQYFIATYGEAGFAQMHLNLARDMRFEEALQQVTGGSLADFNKAWAAWLVQ